jgi:DNA-binding NarL/FixJ family response regulator
MASVRVLIADDHPLFREALKIAINVAAPNAIVAEAGDVREALAISTDGTGLDLILLDLKMSDADGFSGLAQINAASNAAVLVVSGSEDRQVQRTARALGAAGFLPKSATFTHMVDTIRSALDGADLWRDFEDDTQSADANAIAELTPTQLKVLTGILRGRLNKQIAFDLGISEATVKAHVTALMRKLNVRSRTQAVITARALAVDLGIG